MIERWWLKCFYPPFTAVFAAKKASNGESEIMSSQIGSTISASSKPFIRRFSKQFALLTGKLAVIDLTKGSVTRRWTSSRASGAVA